MPARDFRQVAAGLTGQYWLKTCATWDTQVENLCYEGHRYGSTSVAVPWRMTRPAASSTTQVAARFAKPWSCVTTTMV